MHDGPNPSDSGLFMTQSLAQSVTVIVRGRPDDKCGGGGGGYGVVFFFWKTSKR